MMRTLAKAGISLGIALAGCAAVSHYELLQPNKVFSPEERLEIHRRALEEYENAVRIYGEEMIIKGLVKAIYQDSGILE